MSEYRSSGRGRIYSWDRPSRGRPQLSYRDKDEVEGVDFESQGLRMRMSEKDRQLLLAMAAKDRDHAEIKEREQLEREDEESVRLYQKKKNDEYKRQRQLIEEKLEKRRRQKQLNQERVALPPRETDEVTLGRLRAIRSKINARAGKSNSEEEEEEEESSADDRRFSRKTNPEKINAFSNIEPIATADKQVDKANNKISTFSTVSQLTPLTPKPESINSFTLFDSLTEMATASSSTAVFDCSDDNLDDSPQLTPLPVPFEPLIVKKESKSTMTSFEPILVERNEEEQKGEAELFKSKKFEIAKSKENGILQPKKAHACQPKEPEELKFSNLTLVDQLADDILDDIELSRPYSFRDSDGEEIEKTSDIKKKEGNEPPILLLKPESFVQVETVASQPLIPLINKVLKEDLLEPVQVLKEEILEPVQVVKEEILEEVKAVNPVERSLKQEKKKKRLHSPDPFNSRGWSKKGIAIDLSQIQIDQAALCNDIAELRITPAQDISKIVPLPRKKIDDEDETEEDVERKLRHPLVMKLRQKNKAKLEAKMRGKVSKIQAEIEDLLGISDTIKPEDDVLKKPLEPTLVSPNQNLLLIEEVTEQKAGAFEMIDTEGIVQMPIGDKDSEEEEDEIDPNVSNLKDGKGNPSGDLPRQMSRRKKKHFGGRHGGRGFYDPGNMPKYACRSDGGDGPPAERFGSGSGVGTRPGFGGGRPGGRSGAMTQMGPGRMPEAAYHKSLVVAQDPGKEGVKVNLIGNFYRVLVKSITFYHYDLQIAFDKQITHTQKLEEIDPTCELSSANANDQKFIQRFAPEIFAKFVAHHDADFKEDIAFVFDGFKNVYTMKPINLTGKALSSSILVPVDERNRLFLVKLHLVDTIDSSVIEDYYRGGENVEIEQKLITAYEIFFKHLIVAQYEQFQRKFFDINTASGGGRGKLVEYVSGFYNSVRQAEFGMALNVHLKTACVVSREVRSVSDLACMILNINASDLDGSAFQPRHLSDLNRIARHLKVFTDHSGNKITYTIDSIVGKKASQLTFTRMDPDTKVKVTVSVHDYFIKGYGLKLADLPLVKTTGRNARYLPMELCKMTPGQFLNSNKISSEIQRELLTRSTHTPDVYFDKLQGIIEKVTRMNPPLYNKFGLELTDKPSQFTGRVLQAPKLQPPGPRDPFHKTISDVEIAIFGLDSTLPEKVLQDFAKSMMNEAQQLGFRNLQMLLVKNLEIKTLADLKNIIININKNIPTVGLVFFGIPTMHRTLSGSSIYSMIKHLCDQKAGIVTQCFKTANAQRTPRGYFENLLLKVNGKTGGQNNVIDTHFLQKLPIDNSKTMVMGVDVNHPGDLERIHSSIASVVASMDPMFSSFYTTMRVQKKDCDEIVTELDIMMEELLFEYARRNHHFPDNILVFRDGVSESQFSKLVLIEIPQVCRMVKKICKDAKVTWIVIQKRHHSRFVLAQPNTSGRRTTFNVASGTVVDQTIVEPTFPMFYLNSHFSPLGTSKPTKYIVLRDEACFTTDEIQRICFYICFNCVRTRQVIAIPTAVRYADLCAYRSKLHIDVQREQIHNDVRARDSPVVSENKIIDNLNRIIQIDQRVKDRLYYA